MSVATEAAADDQNWSELDIFLHCCLSLFNKRTGHRK